MQYLTNRNPRKKKAEIKEERISKESTEENFSGLKKD